MARALMRAPGWGMGWVGWMVALAAGRLVAEEPAAAFLNALRENRYNDAALVYLDRVEADSRIPEEFRQEIPLQRGMTMIQAAVLERDGAVRERQLNGAKENLERFLREQPDHPKKSSARRQFGILLGEWARIKVEQAARTSEASMRKEAAGLYDQAFQVFDNAVTELREQLVKLNEQPELEAAEGASEQLKTLRNEYLDSLLRRAEIVEDKADTEPADSAERKKLLNDAAKLYSEIFSKYSKRLWGFRARLNEIRVLVKLGELDKAQEYFVEDVLIQADANPPPPEQLERKLITQGFLMAMDCWLHESRKEFAPAITHTAPWLSQIRPAEKTDPDWIMLELQLAKAYRAQAEQLQAADPRDPQIKAMREEARQLAREVARAPGASQDEARTLLGTIPGGVAGADAAAKPAASTFEEAKTNAVDAVSEMQNEQEFLNNVPDRLAKETVDGIKAELRKQMATAEESVTRNRALAMENLLLALQLADAQTPVDDLNLVRRLLAYLDYMQEDYYDAVVLGEFVARTFPGSAGSQLCAQIALSAYLKLYEASEADDKEFATQHIVSLAKYIVDTWAGSPEAADAVNTLIPFLISRGEMAKAREYVQGIPENSPQRASAELRVGESLWRDYLIGMDQVRQWEREVQEPDAAKDELNANLARRKPELEEVKQNALSILETGVDRMRQSGTVDSTVPRAVLALAQIYVNLDQAPKAIALLDDEQIGVLPMVQRKDAAIDVPELREHAYRVALSAVVSALPKVTGGEERAALIERSQQLMQALRTEVGDTPAAQQRLVEVFYSLARGLETQIKLLERPEDRRLMSDGFSAFLDQVRAKATDLRVLNWVAESYAGLGNGLANDRTSTDAAHICFVNAVETYQQILSNAESLELTPDLLRQLLVRQALARRSAGQYEEAIQAFRKVLAEDDRKVDVQVEAAMTYQLWAAEPKQTLKYKSAIGGAELDPKSQKEIIWGWNRIAQATARFKEYREVYHQARYNAAYCYFEYGSHMRTQADREKYLKFAKDCIVLTYRLNPKLGGKEWQAKYNALLKKVQAALNESPVGLGEPAAKK